MIIPAGLKDEYEERAAIMHYDGCMTKDRAEQLAYCRVVCDGKMEGCKLKCPRIEKLEKEG